MSKGRQIIRAPNHSILYRGYVARSFLTERNKTCGCVLFVGKVMCIVYHPGDLRETHRYRSQDLWSKMGRM